MELEGLLIRLIEVAEIFIGVVVFWVILAYIVISGIIGIDSIGVVF